MRGRGIPQAQGMPRIACWCWRYVNNIVCPSAEAGAGVWHLRSRHSACNDHRQQSCIPHCTELACTQLQRRRAKPEMVCRLHMHRHATRLCVPCSGDGSVLSSHCWLVHRRDNDTRPNDHGIKACNVEVSGKFIIMNQPSYVIPPWLCTKGRNNTATAFWGHSE